jgi:hypothetical protein
MISFSWQSQSKLKRATAKREKAREAYREVLERRDARLMHERLKEYSRATAEVLALEARGGRG